MQRFLLVAVLSLAGSLSALALTPLTFAQFSELDEKALDPYITDYFVRYPEQKGCEKIVRNFFTANPPNQLMPFLKEKTPVFYAGIKAKAEAAEAGDKKAKYSLDEFLRLPEAEHRELAAITGGYLHSLLTDENSKKSLENLLRKENRALGLVYAVVQTHAEKTTPWVFTENLARIVGGLAQLWQAADKKN